jgi:hypothetical protein
MRVRLVDVTDEGQWTGGTEPMAVKTRIAQPSVEERQARGKEARSRTPPSSHTGWAAADDRPDPVGLSDEQNELDYQAFVKAIRSGRLETFEGV